MRKYNFCVEKESFYSKVAEQSSDRKKILNKIPLPM